MTKQKKTKTKLPPLAAGQLWKTSGGKIVATSKWFGDLELIDPRTGADASPYWYRPGATDQDFYGVAGSRSRSPVHSLVEYLGPANQRITGVRQLELLMEDVHKEVNIADGTLKRLRTLEKSLRKVLKSLQTTEKKDEA